MRVSLDPHVGEGAMVDFLYSPLGAGSLLQHHRKPGLCVEVALPPAGYQERPKLQISGFFYQLV